MVWGVVCGGREVNRIFLDKRGPGQARREQP